MEVGVGRGDPDLVDYPGPGSRKDSGEVERTGHARMTGRRAEDQRPRPGIIVLERGGQIDPTAPIIEGVGVPGDRLPRDGLDAVGRPAGRKVDGVRKQPAPLDRPGQGNLDPGDVLAEPEQPTDLDRRLGGRLPEGQLGDGTGLAAQFEGQERRVGRLPGGGWDAMPGLLLARLEDPRRAEPDRRPAPGPGRVDGPSRRHRPGAFGRDLADRPDRQRGRARPLAVEADRDPAPLAGRHHPEGRHARARDVDQFEARIEVDGQGSGGAGGFIQRPVGPPVHRRGVQVDRRRPVQPEGRSSGPIGIRGRVAETEIDPTPDALEPPGHPVDRSPGLGADPDPGDQLRHEPNGEVEHQARDVDFRQGQRERPPVRARPRAERPPRFDRRRPGRLDLQRKLTIRGRPDLPRPSPLQPLAPATKGPGRPGGRRRPPPARRPAPIGR